MEGISLIGVSAPVASLINRFRLDAEGEQLAGEGLHGLEAAYPSPLGRALEDATVALTVLQVDLPEAELDDAVAVDVGYTGVLVRLERDPVA
jgi:hypothetical protein